MIATRENIIQSEFEGKSIKIELSPKAQKQIERIDNLHIGMEIYFSCFVKKILLFTESQPEFSTESVSDKLKLYFRPVQSQSCNIHDLVGKNEPTLIEFPVIKRKAIIPSYLFIDYRKGTWKGDFTWKRSN